MVCHTGYKPSSFPGQAARHFDESTPPAQPIGRRAGYTLINTEHMKKIVCIALPLLLLAACQMRESAESGGPKPFFDLKGYINAQIEALNALQPTLEKRIQVDGQNETQELDSLDYEKELRMFLRSDINRKAWFDKYEVDSTFENGTLESVRYTTDTEDLKTSLLEVEYEQGEVSRIYIENKTESVVADVRQELLYEPGQGYRLFTAQKTAMSSEQEVIVEVEWD
jgi:hypothetical protein